MITQADWESAQSGDIEVRNRILLSYQNLVEFCANSMSKGMPSHIDKNDLISSGQFGLIDAVGRFDYERGLQFETFAVQRIRGAILDELRAQDWVPRSVRSRERNLARAVETATAASGVPPSTAELVEMTDMSESDIAKTRASSDRSQIHTLDMKLDSNRPNSTGSISLAETVTSDVGGLSEMFDNVDPEVVVAAIDRLDNREVMVVTMHYYLGKSLAEIGREFKVTESRVCQIHTKALKTIREGLK